ncbi:MAG TPA: DUF4405 domain-containing protein [Chitinivibrionales bacterium]|jgi:hypothetical protein|nr:DUF4405 domain-containing protein [Chitinivibrionales bacterium]
MAFTKVAALKIVNPVSAVVVTVQLTTAVMLTFFAESIPFGLVRQIHLYTGYFLITLIVIHVVLNWSWVKLTFFKKNR